MWGFGAIHANRKHHASARDAVDPWPVWRLQSKVQIPKDSLSRVLGALAQDDTVITIEQPHHPSCGGH